MTTTGSVSTPFRRPDRLFGGYVFDLDGTLYLGDHLLPGAAETVAAIREHGARVAFLTNKPLERPAAYAAKLSDLGIPAVAADVVSSTDALVLYLQRHAAGARLLVIGEPLIGELLGEAGFAVVPLDRPEEADAGRRVVGSHLRLREADRGLPGGPGGRPDRGHQPRPVLPDPRRRPARLCRDAGRHRGLDRRPRRGRRGQALGAHGRGPGRSPGPAGRRHAARRRPAADRRAHGPGGGHGLGPGPDRRHRRSMRCRAPRSCPTTCWPVSAEILPSPAPGDRP